MHIHTVHTFGNTFEIIYDWHYKYDTTWLFNLKKYPNYVKYLNRSALRVDLKYNI